MAAYFANGGRRAYVVRVTPSDATLAEGKIQSTTQNQEILTVGTDTDGATSAFTKTAATSVLKDNAGASPIRGSTLTVRWRAAAAAITNENLRNRADSADVAVADGVADYELRVDPSSIPTYDEQLDALATDGSDNIITLSFDPDGNGDRDVPITYNNASTAPVSVNYRMAVLCDTFANMVDDETFTLNDGTNTPTVFQIKKAGGGADPGNVEIDLTGDVTASDVRDTVLGAINGVGATLLLTASNIAGVDGFYLDHDTNTRTSFSAVNGITAPAWNMPTTPSEFRCDPRSGFISVGLTGNDVPDSSAAGDWRADFTPAAATVSMTDNGSGVFSSVLLTADGAVSYTDGSFNFTTKTANIPHKNARVLATYTINAWDLDPVSKGIWGNDLRVQVKGNSDNYTAASGAYSKHDLTLLLKNSDGNYEVKETYEALDFVTTTAADFFASVLNDLSDLVTVTEPGGNEAPLNLSGVGRSEVLAGGNGAAVTIATTSLTHVPLLARSVTITYTDTSGATKTITDDGNGALTGDVSAAGTNTIDYTTGAVEVTTLSSVKGGSLFTVSYATAPTDTTVTEDFGDTAKSYTAGTDGDFAANYGRNQLTSSALLSSTNKGLYALSLIDEIMQVVVPDFAGDVTVTTDLLDYADTRAALPSGGDRYIVLSTPNSLTAQQAADWFTFDLNRFSNYAAIYWPWVKVVDPILNNRERAIPPLGHVAGIYARTDTTRNVGKSPGGTVDGALKFLARLEREPTLGDRDHVYPRRINPLISSPQTGLAVWGVRQISNESDWKYISARRLFMFLEKSVYNSTFWIVFENNGPALWARIKAQIEGFLSNLFTQGYFAGTTPSEAYMVVVDESNNSAASIALGQVNIDIGVAVNKPAEFVTFRFTQLTNT